MTCPARLVMVEARNAIANVLDNYALARMRGLSDRHKIRRVRVGSIAFRRSPARICSPAPVSHFGHWSPVGQFAGDNELTCRTAMKCPPALSCLHIFVDCLSILMIAN
jgi:hypothetical protein